MVDLVDQMEKLAHAIYYRKQQHRVFSETIPINKQKSSGKSCWNCETDFDDNDYKVLDHSRFSGKFLGWDHGFCNVNKKTKNFTPIIAQNVSLMICTIFASHYTNDTPETNLQLKHRWDIYQPNAKRLIAKHLDQKNRLIQMYKDLRFLDSFRFMNTSIETLVESLPDDNFKILHPHFEKYQFSDIKLLHGKGVYP